MGEVLNKLVETYSELKAKIYKVDRERHEIEGKSKTTWLKWGSNFHISIFKGQSDLLVVIEDLVFGVNDFSSGISTKPFQSAFHALRWRSVLSSRSLEIASLPGEKIR